MGGGKRKPFKSYKKSNPGTGNSKSLFVEGGILAGFDSPLPSTSRRGKNSIGQSGSRSFVNSGNGSVSDSKSGVKHSPVIAFRYDYPSFDKDVLQSESCIGDKNVDGGSIGSRPIVLLGNKDSKVVVFEDPAPSMEASEVAYQYEYSSGFLLGESSHSGLGFSEETDTAPGVGELSSGLIDEEEELHRGLGFSERPETNETSRAVLSSKALDKGGEPSHDPSSHEIEGDAGGSSMDEDDSGSAQQFPNENSYPDQNSAFVSIGGVRVYTQDIYDEESEEENEELSDDGSSSDTSDSDGSEDSEDASEFDSDVDEDVMADYLEGIGGSSQILDTKWLALQDLDGQAPDDDSDDDSSDEFGETLKKLSGVALQEASREYGVQKRLPKNKLSAQSHKSKGAAAWSSSLDDLMFVKDPRRLSAKKKHVAQFPQSWPSKGRKSHNYGRYPGEKKKHRKEMMAVKRRERMIRRGVDLEQINSKLKQMVLNNVDMHAFHLMHARDCSQVQRLAAIYRLKSGCQGSGKKRFVTVSRTQHTCMPSASDEVRLEKLIGASKDDGDFSVIGTPQRAGSRPAQSKSAKSSANRQGSSGMSERKRSGQKAASYASQPMSFVSSGVMQTDAVQVSVVESKDSSPNEEGKTITNPSATVGSFEVHTKGFGSKMMAKMGFVDGQGLGKDGKGMSQPIEVTQRPKSLGLGMTFDEGSIEPVKVAKQSGGTPRNRNVNRNGNGSPNIGSSDRHSFSGRTPRNRNGNGSPNIGAFERHTTGFGSKMMAKMGFVEGTGLGRDSQGIVTPLSAVRRPKARGLGAEDKRS